MSKTTMELSAAVACMIAALLTLEAGVTLALPVAMAVVAVALAMRALVWRGHNDS